MEVFHVEFKNPTWYKNHTSSVNLYFQVNYTSHQAIDQ